MFLLLEVAVLDKAGDDPEEDEKDQPEKGQGYQLDDASDDLDYAHLPRGDLLDIPLIVRAQQTRVVLVGQVYLHLASEFLEILKKGDER